jgi:hydrogenase nickel incorporation protein HypA/HybF
MHELGLARAVVDACASRVAGARVLRVRVEVGQLVAVEPASLQFCFEACARGTPVAGAALDLITIPGMAQCETCGRTVALAAPFGRCVCGGTLRILAGEEFRVKDMEIA